jgi:streptogramin lyase
LAQGLLQSGDIVYADSGNAVDGGFIIKVEATTSQQVVLSSGGLLIQPFDVALDQSGRIIVSDMSGRLIRIVPGTGEQVLLADNSVAPLGIPCGIALDSNDAVLVANTQAILRVSPATGQVQVVAGGGKLGTPIAVARTDTGDLFVLTAGTPRAIVRVNLPNGQQRLVSQGGYFKNPQSIALVNNTLFVTDVATPDGNFGVGCIIAVNIRTGKQSVLTQGGYLVGPVGIAATSNGELVVGDPYTIDPTNPDPYSGGIIRVDLATGSQTLLARGKDGYVNPRGLTSVP